jgi:hypothetical protein
MKWLKWNIIFWVATQRIKRLEKKTRKEMVKIQKDIDRLGG